jgi:hypothetical protein
MIRLFFTLIVLFSVLQNGIAQQQAGGPANPIPAEACVSIDTMSSWIRQNFNTDTARIRAVYNWVTTHISYDVPGFLARDANRGKPQPGVAEVLFRRTAVCQGYADLFVALCRGAGIEARTIGGYAKIHGKVNEISHGWVAAILEGEWFLFDPTWGAGFVRNDVFVREHTNKFYKVTPIKFIEDHMPFDPMYQLLSYPVSHQEFEDGKPAAGKTFFSYSDSIRLHNALSEVAQAGAELRRMEVAGISRIPLQERAKYLQQVVEAAASKNAFGESQKSYRYMLKLYRAFMDLKRSQFANTPDADVRAGMDSIGFYIDRSRSLLANAIPASDAHRDAKASLTASIDKISREIAKQKEFTLKYLATAMEKRKQLFMQ